RICGGAPLTPMNREAIRIAPEVRLIAGERQGFGTPYRLAATGTGPRYWALTVALMPSVLEIRPRKPAAVDMAHHVAVCIQAGRAPDGAARGKHPPPCARWPTPLCKLFGGEPGIRRQCGQRGLCGKPGMRWPLGRGLDEGWRCRRRCTPSLVYEPESLARLT